MGGMVKPSLEYGSLHVRVYVLLAALSCGLGGVILAGREHRFSGPAWDDARDLVSWTGFEAWKCWGVLFLVYGLTLVIALGRPIAVHVIRFGMIPYIFLAISFGTTAAADPRTALTGLVAYFIVFCLHAVTADHLARYSWAG